MKKTGLKRYGTGAALALWLGVAAMLTEVPVWAATGTAVDNVNVRSEASSSSGQVGSVARGQSVEVGEATTNAAGERWYAVTLSGGTTGYIRADLINVTEDATASEGTTDAAASDAGTDDASSDAAAAAEVARAIGDGYAVAMTPTNATVSQNVNVRSGAGTGYTKIGELNAGTTLVVIGQAKDDADAVWYQFYTTGTEQQMTGFIRYDYITLGDAVVTETTAADTTTQTDTASPKDYEAVYTQDENGTDTWYLYNNAAGTRRKISDIDAAIEQAQTLAAEGEKGAAKFRNIAVILGVLLLVAALAIGALVLRLRRSYNERGEVDLMADRKKQERRRSLSARGTGDADSRTERSARPVRDRSAYPAGGAARRAPAGMQDGDGRDGRTSRRAAERPAERTDRPARRRSAEDAAERRDNPETVRRGSALRSRDAAGEPAARRERASRPAQGYGEDRRPSQGSQPAASAAPQNFANLNTGELDEEEFSFLTDDQDQ